MRIVRFLPDAELEFRESVLWYSTQQKGLEIEFVRCIDECIARIKRNPNQYPQVFKHLRKAVVKRFPFIIVYDYSVKEIIIYAVFHSRRNPKLISHR